MTTPHDEALEAAEDAMVIIDYDGINTEEVIKAYLSALKANGYQLVKLDKETIARAIASSKCGNRVGAWSVSIPSRNVYADAAQAVIDAIGGG